MAGPWEEYKAEEAKEKKPWEEFAGTEASAKPEESFLEQATRGAINTVPPVLGAMAGAVAGSGLGPAGTLAGGGLGYAAGQEISGLARHHILGEEAPSTEPLEQAKRVGTNVVEGAAAELAGPALAKGGEVVSGAVPKAISGVAERLAVLASGAKKAGPRTGRALLEEGAVEPLSSRAGIQARAKEAQEAAGENIGEALDQIKEGTSPLKIVKLLQDKIADYSRTPGSERVVKRLQDIQEAILEGSKLKEPPGHLKTYSARELEEIKRKYQNLVNYQRKTRLPQTTQANAEAASALKGHVEGMAREAGPEVEQQFLKGKETFGALAPVLKEGGTNVYGELGKDVASYGLGELYDKLRGTRGHGLALALARRGLQTAPVASTAAVGANLLSKGLGAAGQALPGAIPAAARASSYLLTPKAVKKAQTPLQGLMNHLTPQDTNAKPSAAVNNEMMKNLARVDQQNPDLLNKSGLSLPELERHIANHASKLGNMQGVAPARETSVKDLSGPSGPAQVGRSVYEQTGPELRQMADYLQDQKSKDLQYIGNSLIRALDNKDSIAKNAILFNLLQSPRTRKVIKAELPENQGDMSHGQEDERQDT